MGNSDPKNHSLLKNINTNDSIPAMWDETVNGFAERLAMLKEKLNLAYAGTDKCLAVKDANRSFHKLFDTFPSRYLNKHLGKVVKSATFGSYVESLLNAPNKPMKQGVTFLFPGQEKELSRELSPLASNGKEIICHHVRLTTGGFLFFFEESRPDATSEEAMRTICRGIQKELEKSTKRCDAVLGKSPDSIALDVDHSRRLRGAFHRLRRLEQTFSTYAALHKDYACYSAPLSLRLVFNQALDRLVEEVLAEIRDGHEPPSLSSEEMKKGVLLEIDQAVDMVEGESKLMEELFYQLLHNAWKFKNPKFRVYVQITHHNNHYVILFKDNGRGIAPALKERIFSPFFQGPHTAGQYSGVGLGLAIARRIVELHNGEIQCDESHEQSACFHVRLPLPEN